MLPIHPHPQGFVLETLPAYLRVAGISIALWDYLSTVPGEVRLYRRQVSFARISRACVLFIAIRYLSVVSIALSSIGFFGSFSSESCQRFYLVVPCMKMVAYVVSQLILGVRTYAISARSRWVLWTLTILFICTLPLEIVGTVVDRVVAQNVFHNCTSGNPPEKQRAWYHYMAAMVYDVVALGIASGFLYAHSEGATIISGLVKSLFEDGLIYFVALTAANIVNVVLFRQSAVALQSAAATTGQAFTMIFSQKLLLNLSSLERNSWHMPSVDIAFKQSGHSHIRTLRRHRSLSDLFPSLERHVNDTELGGIRVDKEIEIKTETLRDAHESITSIKTGTHRRA